ncbi:Uncharacterised protein [Mycobacteroides abscessus subsp. abscessus]|uniref:DUF4381 domain-containing protein n=2 Tax=Mycobacteroides abscessus TaxID=36809 RepID=A0AB33T4P7_9MYCO|nr:hypothetical protein [Mycobacteroides abscessus]EUA49288.1 hypothetical protein I543_0726 [Mycobacteroides abscessus 21]AWG48254.1 hypothetical protein DDT48_01735 [Mycobacteroides abscessus]EIC66724.1 hypothetical protein S7W_15725 [Mycobacteroides abscessus M94]MBE5440339.1 hypothetical protein [Mycobacteroides abscessus]MBE5467236.1 hypothetical protein [Mycobacteroides abscessus]
MPHDYLKWVVAPLPYSVLWLVLGVIMILLVIGWCIGIFVWTMPVEKLRSIPVVRDISARVLRRKFNAAIDKVRRDHEAGALDSRQAHGAMSRVLRTFIYMRTGVRAPYMSLGEVAHSGAARVAPVVAQLYSGQFEMGDDADVAAAAAAVRDVIQSWS